MTIEDRIEMEDIHTNKLRMAIEPVYREIDIMRKDFDVKITQCSTDSEKHMLMVLKEIKDINIKLNSIMLSGNSSNIKIKTLNDTVFGCLDEGKTGLVKKQQDIEKFISKLTVASSTIGIVLSTCIYYLWEVAKVFVSNKN